MGKAMRDYRIWVEVSDRKRRCHRCGGDVGEGVMFVHMGDRSRPRRARTLCATCFETIMNDLSHDFHILKEKSSHPPCAPVRADGVLAESAGPHCFACGQPPERCLCGQEAYR